MNIVQTIPTAERAVDCSRITVHKRTDGRFGFTGALIYRAIEIRLDERAFQTIVEARNAAERWALAHGAEKVYLVLPTADWPMG